MQDIIKKIYQLLFVNKQLSQIILKNTFWVLIPQIIAKALKIGLMIVAAHQLGPTVFGEANYIIVLSTLCYALSDIGISMLVNREYQQKNIDKTQLISSTWAIKLILIAINTYLGLHAYYLWIPY